MLLVTCAFVGEYFRSSYQYACYLCIYCPFTEIIIDFMKATFANKQFLKLRSELILKHDKSLNVPVLPFFFFLFSLSSHWEGGSEQRAVWC